MNLDYLNHLIPKRWILLLYYWLPFFQTPSNFYFQSREFIDHLIKHSIFEDFPLEKLPDLMVILVKYASITNEKKIARKIIAEIFSRKTKKIRLNFLASILEKFNPEDKNISIIDEIFQRIPDKFYFDHFKPLLKGENFSVLNLKWCAYFKDKFSLKDRLNLCLSLSDDKLIAHQAILSTLVIEECEKRFIQDFDLSLLNDKNIKRLLNIILKSSSSNIFSNKLLRSFVNELLKKSRESSHSLVSIIDSTLRPLDVYARYTFFKNFLAQMHNTDNIEYFLGFCPTKQWPTLIDHVIVSVFNATDTKMDKDITEESMIEANPNLLLLAPLQKRTINFPINLFQFLAIQFLIKQPFNLKLFKTFFLDSQTSINHHQTFSAALQFAVAESYISAIKVYIKEQIMIYVPKKNKRQDIHHIFKQFCNYDNYEKFLKIKDHILNKLPEDLRGDTEADLNVIQQLLSQLYLILEEPSVIQYKNELMMKEINGQRHYEEKTHEARELLVRISEGSQTRVSFQRMKELFGDNATAVQEKWNNSHLNVHFFDGNDKEELKLAKKEAEAMKRLNRECSELYSISAISCGLSTSPYLINHLNY